MLKPNLTYDNAEARAYLEQRGGSKAGVHAYLFDKEPELRKHLPKSDYLPAEEDAEIFAESIDFDTPKIVRGCHYLDVTGLVDVLKTQIVRTRQQLRRAIENIRTSAKSDAVKNFAEYESDKPFDGKIGVLVQTYHGEHHGSIVEHPHKKGIYRIEEQIPTQGDGIFSPKTWVNTYFADSTGRLLNIDTIKRMRMPGQSLTSYVTPGYMNNSRLEYLTRAVALYRKVVESGIYPHSHAPHMEFGIDGKTREIMAYQARIFRAYEEAQDFDPHELIRKQKNSLAYGLSLPFQTFGITQGMTLPMTVMYRDSVAKHKDKKEMAYAWGNASSRKSTDLDIMPKNISAFLPFQFAHALEHGYFRWIQKADVSVLGFGPQMQYIRWHLMGQTDGTVEDEDVFMPVHIVSNGIFGAFVPLL